ncbi:hypothetical protein CEXT_184111, partial [Caerostris extrusa]
KGHMTTYWLLGLQKRRSKRLILGEEQSGLVLPHASKRTGASSAFKHHRNCSLNYYCAIFIFAVEILH